jgi:1,4-dihydroxy-2-naphthoate octaprenyltransferase
LLAGVSPLAGVLAMLVGLSTSVILFCSHWHQIQGDLRAGKMSPLVRLGTEKACKVSRTFTDSCTAQPNTAQHSTA